MNAIQTRVKMVQHVLMVLTPTPAHVTLDTRELIVKQVTMYFNFRK